MAALRHDRITAPWFIEGPINGGAFLLYTEKVLVTSALARPRCCRSTKDHGHVLAAERIHGDDTTVPVLAKVQTRTGGLWVYVRGDQPFGGKAPPGAV